MLNRTQHNLRKPHPILQINDAKIWEKWGLETSKNYTKKHNKKKYENANDITKKYITWYKEDDENILKGNVYTYNEYQYVQKIEETLVSSWSMKKYETWLFALRERECGVAMICFVIQRLRINKWSIYIRVCESKLSSIFIA